MSRLVIWGEFVGPLLKISLKISKKASKLLKNLNLLEDATENQRPPQERSNQSWNSTKKPAPTSSKKTPTKRMTIP